MAKISDIIVKVDTSDAADAIRELVDRLESVCTVTPEMRRVVMEWFGRRIARAEISGKENTRLRTELATARAQLTALTTAPAHLTAEEDQALKEYASELNAEMAKDCLVLGKFYRHPHSDRLLIVTDGSYLGGYGRVSNFWHWSYLDDDFSPVDESGQGYGWAAKPVERPQVCDHCGVPANEESDRDEQCSVCGKGDDR